MPINEFKGIPETVVGTISILLSATNAHFKHRQCTHGHVLFHLSDSHVIILLRQASYRPPNNFPVTLHYIKLSCRSSQNNNNGKAVDKDCLVFFSKSLLGWKSRTPIASLNLHRKALARG